MLSQPALRDEVDRIGAAVQVRVIHVAGSTPVSRKTWSAAAAVILDEEAAVRCGHDRLPRRAHVIVLTGAEPTGTTWRAAIAVGAQRVLTLPADEDALVRELAEAGEAARDGERRGEVIAVIGGRGGAGASLFATALAQTAGDALLVDLDPWGGGIDLLTGSENTPGLRWPELALQGGRLTWPAVREALPRHPRHPGVSVLSGTRRGYELDRRAVDAVVDAGHRGGATVICDLPRAATNAAETALDAADLVVLVTPCDVRACAASTAIAPRLRTANPNAGLVARGPSPGGLRAAEIADITGLPLLASMRAEPRLCEQLEHGGLWLRRRSALAAAARRVLDVLRSRPHTVAAMVAAA
jgi:secretion/DNA translocation related CpaE-like protein